MLVLKSRQNIYSLNDALKTGTKNNFNKIGQMICNRLETTSSLDTG